MSFISNIVHGAGNLVSGAASALGFNGWSGLRNDLETAAVLAGNYVLPGSAAITSHLVSDGSKQQLGSSLGQLAQLGTGVGGGYEGNLQNYGAGLQDLGFNTSGAANTIGQTASDTFGLNPNTQFAARTPWGNLSSGGWTPSSMLPTGANAVPTTGAGGYNPITGSGGGNIPPGGIPNAFMPTGGATGGANPMGWGSPMNILQMGTGLYGMAQGAQMKALAQQQMDAAAAQRGSVPLPTAQSVTQTPGYEAGLEAVQRSMLAQGYQGSGNMMGALQQYGGQAYQNAMQNYLANQGLANQSTQLGGNILGNAASLTGSGLGTMSQGALLASPMGLNALYAMMGKNQPTAAQTPPAGG